MTDTINYYNTNAEGFVTGTIDVDMGDLYDKFLQHVPTGGHILDAGCGSGRDSKYFLEHDYQVTAMDGSAEMVASAAKLTGLQVQHQQFDEIYCQQMFDGIWACASVLHVTKAKMVDAINRLSAALKDRGMLYLSFKYGDTEEVRGCRYFSNYTEQSFNQLLDQCDQLQVLEMWTTADARPGRQDEVWLNVLLRK